MRTVICPHCDKTVRVSENLADANCLRCGKPISLEESHVTADSGGAKPSSTAIQTAFTLAADWLPPRVEKAARRTTPYSDWEDFRSNSPTLNRQLADLATRPLPDLRRAELQPLPAGAPDEEELGIPLASSYTPGENRTTRLVVAGIFLPIAFVMVFAALAAAVLAEDPGPIVIVIYALPFGGVGLWALLGRVRSPMTLWIMEKGLLLETAGYLYSAPWSEIDGMRILLKDGSPSCWVIVAGKEALLSTVSDPADFPLIEYVEIKTTAAKFVPVIKQLFNNEEVDFGAATLSHDGFYRERWGMLRWDSIERVIPDHESISIRYRHEHERLRIRYRSVSFPLLLLAIAHVMIEESKWLPKSDP